MKKLRLYRQNAQMAHFFIKIITLGVCLISFFVLSGKLEAQSLYFEHGPDREVPHDSIISIPLIAYGVNNINSMQFTVHWNPHVIEFIEAHVDTSDGFSADNIGTTEAFEGRLYFVFVDPINNVTVSTGDTIMTINFRVKGRPGDHTMFGLQDYPVQLQAFGEGVFKDFLRSSIDIQVLEPAQIGSYYSVCQQVGTEDSLTLSQSWFGVRDTFHYLLTDNNTSDTLLDLHLNTDTNIVINDLVAGSYLSSLYFQDSLVMNDSLNLQAKDSIGALFTSFEGSCPQIADGEIYLDAVTGGRGPYTILWPDSSLHYRELLDVRPGMYPIRIIDMDRCEKVFQVEVEGPKAIVSETINDASCGRATDGSIAVEVSGVPRFMDSTYQFSLNGVSFFNDVRLTTFSLGTGPFTYFIRDSASCIYEIETEIGSQNEILLEQRELIQPTCNASRDGRLSVIAALENPANGSFSYEWTSPPFPAINDSSFVVNDLSAGVYRLTVTHSSLPNICRLRDNFSFVEPTAISIALDSIKPQDCLGTNGGYLSVSIEGGTPTYDILWSTGDSSLFLDSLSGGDYVLSVTDQNGCLKQDTFQVSPGLRILIDTIEIQNVLCHGDSSGSIVFRTSFDNAPQASLSYRLSPIIDTFSSANIVINVIDDLGPGSYTLEIVSDSGCLLDSTLIISEPPPLVIDSLVTIRTTCDSIGSGTIFISVNGGTGNDYTYTWSNSRDSNFIDSLLAGTYTVSVTDRNGCRIIDSFDIRVTDGPSLGISTISNPGCFGDSTGLISLEIITGASAIENIIWNTGDSGAILSDVPAGIYEVVARDSNQCILTDTFELSQPNPLELSIQSTPDTSNQGVGRAAAAISGGTPPYQYLWNTSPEQLDSVVQNLTSGWYTITITDSNNCSLTDSVFVDGITASTHSRALSFALFPNPNSGQFSMQLEAPDQVRAIHIWDQSGRLIYRQDIKSLNEELKFQITSSGQYYIEVLYKKGERVFKPIVIQQ